MATGLPEFIPLLANQDIKKRIQLGCDIISYLQSPDSCIECEELGYFIDSISSWLSNSNFKVSQNGIEILAILADRMKEDFRPYISTVLPAAADRLGDSKDQVRLQAKYLILKLMDPVSSPQHIFEKLATALNHKNWRVREEVMMLLQQTLDQFGASSLTISKLMPMLVKLLGDPHSQVRDAAMSTLVHVYKHVGERLRLDLSKRPEIPPQKLNILFAKFDEVKASGSLLKTAFGRKGSGSKDDEVDSKSQSTTKAAAKRASSAPPSRRGAFTTSKPTSSAASSAAGAADEEMFIKAFEDVPRIQIYSTKELESELGKIKEVLGDPSNDWEKRVDACKRLRSLLIAGAADYEELYQHLRLLEHPFQISVKDLRSQVVRESCITIAYLSQQLGSKLDHFSEMLLPSLINLIPNSAKIMSSAGVVAIHFIIQFTHVSRLIPIIANQINSKSKEIRKTCLEFLDQLLHTWPTHTLEKHVALLQDSIRKGISDADPEARAFSRKAFWGFADHFREQADSLLNSLDNSKQRMLQGELTMSNSSSSNSLTATGRPFCSSSYGHCGSVENLSWGRGGSMSRRSGIPILASSKSDPASGIPKQMRSTSAIDLSAVRRAKARATFSTAASLSRGSGASLPRPNSKRADSSVNAITSPERMMKVRSKGASQSQPSSRPDSPSSRLSYATYSVPDGGSGRVRRKSGIPTATGTSRETSPTRTGFAHERRLSGSRTRALLGAGENYSSVSPACVPVMAERILQQSREAEVAVADALRTPARRRYNAFDDQSDESETSSVCSDRSFGSFGGRAMDDISDVIHCLNSIHWSERKEGLQVLQNFLRSSRYLSTIELKKVTDTFTKLFMDPHTKVFTLFLDTLNELIIIHKSDLHNWLYVLLARLFMKLGTDILNSVAEKIRKTLELVRDSFPCDEQFGAITRFLNDQMQTPNMKVKLAVLQYLTSLISIMDPSEFPSTSNETKLGLMKIISWTASPKSSEFRKAGEEVLVALFSLNAPEFSVLLNQLPKTYKDSAFQLLNSHHRRNSSDSSPSLSVRSTPCPVTSHLQSPNTTLPRVRSHNSTPQNCSFEYDDTENLNPQEVYNSIKKTSSEIQEYNFDRGDSDYFRKDKEKSITESASKDSGIQNATPESQLNTLMERLELDSSADSSPTKRSPTDYGSNLYSHSDENLGFDRAFQSDNEMDDDKFSLIVQELKNHNTRSEQKMQALVHLIRLAREHSSVVSGENFKMILGAVIETVEDDYASVRSVALKALCELIKNKADNFHGYVELTILRILQAQKDRESDVAKNAEFCSAVAAIKLPAEQCVRTLKPLIVTGEYPVNQAAIKMLTKLVEQHPKNIIMQLLPDVMPALIKAYDNQESPVRKAAVFCMVAIHGVVGEAMFPHLSSLNGSKMKLLNLYIKRAQAQNSGGSTPGSPGNPPSSSSSH